jgi:hypothetical protein
MRTWGASIVVHYALEPMSSVTQVCRPNQYAKQIVQPNELVNYELGIDVHSISHSHTEWDPCFRGVRETSQDDGVVGFFARYMLNINSCPCPSLV